jgi:hypothetical protein
MCNQDVHDFTKNSNLSVRTYTREVYVLVPATATRPKFRRKHDEEDEPVTWNQSILLLYPGDTAARGTRTRQWRKDIRPSRLSTPRKLSLWRTSTMPRVSTSFTRRPSLPRSLRDSSRLLCSLPSCWSDWVKKKKPVFSLTANCHCVDRGYLFVFFFFLPTWTQLSSCQIVASKRFNALLETNLKLAWILNDNLADKSLLNEGRGFTWLQRGRSGAFWSTKDFLKIEMRIRVQDCHKMSRDCKSVNGPS